MKVGIATRPLLANYGGILQNFALQQALRKLGHDPITIDFIPQYTVYRYIRSLCKTLILWFIPWKRRPFVSYSTMADRNNDVDSFCRKYIVLTNKVHCYKNDLVDIYNMDAVITGSDQVWRAKYNLYPGHLEDMYLKFVHKENVKKLAYAASFGIDEWDYQSDMTIRCSNLAKRFIGISVREKSGVELCDKYLHVRAVTVLDPTLLLEREDYEAVCRKIPRDTSRFIAAYILDLSLSKRQLVEKIANEKGLSVKYFSAHHNIKLSIEEWIAMFRDSDYIVTDSFHGTVFSIIFNKPFMAIGNEGRGLARFHSLLDMFGLQDRICVRDKVQHVQKEIDWSVVNEKRKLMQTHSFDFLRLLND